MWLLIFKPAIFATAHAPIIPRAPLSTCSIRMAWIAAESKKHPGRKYYYNRETKESTWKRPVDFEVRDKSAASLQRIVS